MFGRIWNFCGWRLELAVCRWLDRSRRHILGWFIASRFVRCQLPVEAAPTFLEALFLTRFSRMGVIRSPYLPEASGGFRSRFSAFHGARPHSKNAAQGLGGLRGRDATRRGGGWKARPRNGNLEIEPFCSFFFENDVAG